MSDTPRTKDPGALQHALQQRIEGRIQSNGTVALLPVPALLDLYVERLAAAFSGVGRRLDEAEQTALREALAGPLAEAHEAGPHARVEVRWRSAGSGLKYRVRAVARTAAEAYEEWAAGREPPLFGAHPDAAVLEAAAALPKGARVLDLGAGTGRNAVPLAAAGCEVLAVEIAPSLVQKLRAAGLPAIQGDVLDATLPVAPGAHRLVIASELATHLRGPHELRMLLAAASDWLEPGGILLLDAFVCDPDYAPSEAVRQASAAMWCTVFTSEDLAWAAEDLPLVAESDREALPLEREGQPSWPPTGWFEAWADGRDLFALPAGEPPVRLRWLTWRRT